MKSLKQICEDNIIHPIYEVSILGDIDDQINAYDDSITDRIEKWIKENYECAELKISDNINKNGLYEVSARSVKVKNRKITSLTNGMFEWIKAKYFNCAYRPSLTSLKGAPQDVEGWFDCCECKNLSSLEGAPEKVGGHFYCDNCTSLESLEGAPEKVGGSVYCFGCKLLKSLKGAPKKVGEDFYCYDCPSLESLEGAPQEVGGDFSCHGCTKLESLMGAPKEVGGDFYCYKCKTKFIKDDVIKVSNVKGEIGVK